MATKTDKLSGSSNATDLSVLRRVADKDRRAFAELFENYHPRLFRFLFRLTRSHGVAEEITNDVLLTLWQDAGDFRGESRVSTWVFGIAYRQALKHFRKHRIVFEPLDDQNLPVCEFDSRLEQEDWVRRGIHALPPKQKLTVMLVYFLGLSCAETATATGVPESTVKTRMFHARQKLKTQLVAAQTPQPWLQEDDNDD
jgi:RNA polymerase sigma-70 factor (ECF subfamily)